MKICNESSFTNPLDDDNAVRYTTGGVTRTRAKCKACYSVKNREYQARHWKKTRGATRKRKKRTMKLSAQFLAMPLRANV